MGNQLCSGCDGHLDQLQTQENTREALHDIYEQRKRLVNRNSKELILKGPVGLENISNSCYIAAVLQLMFIVLPDSMSQSKGPVTSLLFKLRDFRTTGDFKRLKAQMEKYMQLVRGNDQQDSQQFLLHLLNLLDSENSQISSKVPVQLNYDQQQSVKNNHEIFIQEMRKIQNSQITQLFSAELLIQLQCSNKHKKHKFQRYQCVSLSFPATKQTNCLSSNLYHNDNPISLKDLILKQFGQQKIKDLLCEQCRQNKQFTKTVNIYTAPQYLILHLSRFKKGSFCVQKIDTPVQFDTIISFMPYNSKVPAKYRLIGTVNHAGSLNRGHFYSHIKYKNGEWYQVNDEKVKQIRMPQYGNQSEFVYILFFERTD